MSDKPAQWGAPRPGYKPKKSGGGGGIHLPGFLKRYLDSDKKPTSWSAATQGKANSSNARRSGGGAWSNSSGTVTSPSTAAPKAKTLSADRQRRRDDMIAAAKRRTKDREAQNTVRKNYPTNYYKMRSEDKAVQAERQRRVGQHQFKGNYYGPDAFKGDQKKIDAWKAAGKPKNKSKFV